MHLAAMIEQVLTYTLGGHDCANWEVVIEVGWRYTSRPWSNGIAQVHGGGQWTVCRVLALYSISKRHFRPSGMATSEWTRSVRAVRDTPVADYSAPGVNTTRRVAHRPPIAVSPFLPQTLQEHSQMLMKAPAVMEVHSGCYEIWLLG